MPAILRDGVLMLQNQTPLLPKKEIILKERNNASQGILRSQMFE